MASYKNIFQNMVIHAATSFAERASGDFFEAVEGTIEMANGNKHTDPDWAVTIRALVFTSHEYRVAGYIDEWGDIRICNVVYHRTYCDPDGSNKRNVTEVLYGEQLQSFKFDC